MSEDVEQRVSVDPSAVRETVEVVLRGADGEVKQTVGRSGLRALVGRMDQTELLSKKTVEELTELADERGIEITENGERVSDPYKQDLVDVLAAHSGPLAVGEVLFEGERHEIKGPGPEWERDAEGGYVNR